MDKQEIPASQCALELIGSDQLRLNKSKKVYQPGPYQILAEVEAVGLCFSDLKLLKQFDKHARKGKIISGIDEGILAEIPSYAPDELPTVPGHEACCKIVAVGDKVTSCRTGQRVLIQTDYRWLKTAKANASFGYNFEGALQQYVLMDERIITEPDTGRSFLIPVDSQLSAAAVALVEPWACVESSYIAEQRKGILADGLLFIVADDGYKIESLRECFSAMDYPSGGYYHLANDEQLRFIQGIFPVLKEMTDISRLPDGLFSDIIYFGSNRGIIELLATKLSAGGLINIVLAGKQIDEDVAIDIGRIHYSGIRWTGTVTDNVLDGYKNIPHSGEIRDADRIIVIGAAGPMGQMHILRLLCSGKKDISITATDLDDDRLKILDRKSHSVARKHNIKLELVNPEKQSPESGFSYYAIMVPLGQFVADAIKNSRPGCLINIFAGIPTGTIQKVDMDRYIKNRCYMFGSSGSRLVDMEVVLDKVYCGVLDTNLSVEAVSGMAGAIDGIRAIEKRRFGGKIIVYPSLVDMPLVKLSEMGDYYPSVARKLEDGLWTKAAENELLRLAR